MIKRVSDINWNDPKYIRSGFIPVSIKNNILFFGFGIGQLGDIADFGGHREDVDRDTLDTAIREYREESLNVFGEITRHSVQNCIALIGQDTIEILLPVKLPFYKYTEDFHKIINGNTSHEVQSIVWLSKQQLLIAIDSQSEEFAGTNIYYMYDKIRITLDRNRDIITNYIFGM